MDFKFLFQGFPSIKVTAGQDVNVDDDGHVAAYQAAVCLLQQVCTRT